MRQVELVITRLSLKSYSAGKFLSLLLCLTSRAVDGVGIELALSEPILILKSFIALPSAAVILLAGRPGRRRTGVVVPVGVGSVLAGVGEPAGSSSGSCAGARTGASSSILSSLSGRPGISSDGGS